MELNWDIIHQNTKEVEPIIKEALEKIKNTTVYKNFKTGKVYKLINEHEKELYIIYSKPSIKTAGVIEGVPLNEELRFCDESYIHEFWLKNGMSIEEVVDDLIREEKDGNLTISDGIDSLTIEA